MLHAVAFVEGRSKPYDHITKSIKTLEKVVTNCALGDYTLLMFAVVTLLWTYVAHVGGLSFLWAALL